jgi:hypothetical protein
MWVTESHAGIWSLRLNPLSPFSFAVSLGVGEREQATLHGWTVAVAESNSSTFGSDPCNHILEQDGSEVCVLHAHTMIPRINHSGHMFAQGWTAFHHTSRMQVSVDVHAKPA